MIFLPWIFSFSSSLNSAIDTFFVFSFIRCSKKHPNLSHQATEHTVDLVVGLLFLLPSTVGFHDLFSQHETSPTQECTLMYSLNKKPPKCPLKSYKEVYNFKLTTEYPTWWNINIPVLFRAFLLWVEKTNCFRVFYMIILNGFVSAIFWERKDTLKQLCLKAIVNDMCM